MSTWEYHSMLISHRKKFIYTKTGRSASTSVEGYFQPYCYLDGQCPEITNGTAQYIGEVGIVGFRGRIDPGDNIKWWGHMPAEKIYSYIGPEIWNSYFKFCTVRNPFDRVLSHFYLDLMHNESEMSPEKFEVYCTARGTNEIEIFRNWLLENSSTDRHNYVIQNQVCMDFFVRLENLHEDLSFVCEKIGVKYEPQKLPTLKQGQTKRKYDIADFYDRSSIEVIEQRYGWELEQFGYTLPQKQLMTKIEI